MLATPTKLGNGYKEQAGHTLECTNHMDDRQWLVTISPDRIQDVSNWWARAVFDCCSINAHTLRRREACKWDLRRCMV